MTAVEKALDLFNKFYKIYPNTGVAIESAKLAVDEMISEHLEDGSNDYVEKRNDFLFDVKQEINKIK